MRPSQLLSVALGAFVLGGAVSATGCEKRKGPQGMAPAESWNAGAAAAPDPHANVPGVGGGADPHANVPGMGGDPHAGVPGMGGDPHAGVPGMGGDPHAGMAMGGTGPGGLPPPDPDRPIDRSKFLRGSIRLGKGLGADRPAGVLFLAVRKADASGNAVGTPIAVEMLPAGTFPVLFELTEAQAMVAGTAFSGQVVISARLDQDQDALTKQPGDITGQVVATIPAEGLELALDTVLR